MIDLQKIHLKNKRFSERHPLYNVWAMMKKRCYNPHDKYYSIYGGRGIKVDLEWMIYFQFERDMLPTYKKGLTLDRINNDESYSKRNCRWATPKQQANNRRTNRVIVYHGKSRTLQQWSEYLGIKQSTLAMRLTQYKWNIERSFAKCP